MTTDEIISMKPGRVLDALVSEKVMGWHTFSPIDPRYDHSVSANGNRRNFAFDLHGKYKPFPLYSTDTEAAWTVVEELRKRYLHIEIMTDEEKWKVRTNADDWVFALDIPEAICKAALLAVLGDKGA